MRRMSCVKFLALLTLLAAANETTAVEIVIASHNKTLPVGFTTHLVCVAYGSPPPSMFWTSSNSVSTISNSTSDRFIIYETTVEDFAESILRIEDLEPADSGDYICNALHLSGAVLRTVTKTNRLAVTKKLHPVAAGSTRKVEAVAVLPLVLLAVSAGVLAFVWHKKCRKLRKKSRRWSKNVRVNEFVLKNSSYGEHEKKLQEEADFAERLVQYLLFHKNDFEILDAIGEGEFSCVYQARLLAPEIPTHTNTQSLTTQRMLAVKTLKGNYSNDDKQNLIKEGVLMHKFDHPNVITLLGICLDAGPTPYVVLPFMENGSLISYLRKNKSKLLSSIETEDEEGRQHATLTSKCMRVAKSFLQDKWKVLLKTKVENFAKHIKGNVTVNLCSACELCMQVVCKVRKRLTDMCWQITKGMEYLAKMKLIHRDLAARNCMIDENWIIKVADFGLSELLTSSKDYFRQSQDVEVKLPLKWLAPECIYEGVYSEKTDVWAFGVTCWEVFTGGASPYPGLHPMSIPKQINQGLRLERPDNAACTDKIYSIMYSCWEEDPKLRPQFSELVCSIGEELETMAEYLNVSTFQ